jgi:hypothetical protein
MPGEKCVEQTGTGPAEVRVVYSELPGICRDRECTSGSALSGAAWRPAIVSIAN